MAMAVYCQEVLFLRQYTAMAMAVIPREPLPTELVIIAASSYWYLRYLLMAHSLCMLLFQASSNIMESLSSARSPTIRASIVALIIMLPKATYIDAEGIYIIQVSKIPV